MVRVRNGYWMDTEREWERMWNGYKTRSVKRSLLGFFWSALYLVLVYLDIIIYKRVLHN